MMKYNAGDIIFASMKYVDANRQKRRPVLVVIDKDGLDDVVVARITSRPPRDSYDLLITDLNSAGLPKVSTLRMSKLAVIPRTAIVRKLGKLSDEDRVAVRAILQRITDQFT